MEEMVRRLTYWWKWWDKKSTCLNASEEQQIGSTASMCFNSEHCHYLVDYKIIRCSFLLVIMKDIKNWAFSLVLSNSVLAKDNEGGTENTFFKVCRLMWSFWEEPGIVMATPLWRRRLICCKKAKPSGMWTPAREDSGKSRTPPLKIRWQVKL